MILPLANYSDSYVACSLPKPRNNPKARQVLHPQALNLGLGDKDPTATQEENCAFRNDLQESREKNQQPSSLH